jgi:SAM-dependent methyltransferase
MQSSPLIQRPDVVLSFSLVAVAAVVTLVVLFRVHLIRLGQRVGAWFSPDDEAGGRSGLSLFLASFATLYIEIMLIRWIGTEVRIFAYVQNLALICCFLGFGLGCYGSGRRKNLLVSLLAIAVLTVLVQAPFHPWQAFLTQLSNQLSISPDAAQWGSLQQHPRTTLALFAAVSVVAVAAFLLLLVVVMVPLGQWVGHSLDVAPNPVRAYTTNLLGSLAGIWAFAGLSFYWLPVGWWFAIGFLLLVIIRRPSVRFAVAAAALLGLCLALLPGSMHEATRTYWSPYQKLVLTELGDGQYRIDVNNAGYMSIYNLTEDYLERNPELSRRFRRESSYDAPFGFARRLDRVLIVGAGAGNDAAAALRHGAGHVDAVEIDPVVHSLGKQLHPEHPYDSPNVQVILDDARAYLRRATGRYDVILFGLLDSHTQFSDYSNMRIDNYVYTEEAFREAGRLLKPDGVLIVKFEVREPWTWLGSRFYAMLEGAFGRPPIVFHADQLGVLTSATVFVTSNDAGLWSRAAEPALAALITEHPPGFSLAPGDAPVTATDDWPYLYHRNHSIPRTYLTVSIVLLALSVLLVGRKLEPRRRSTWHMFLLGGGFLLLETQMISRLALYFGTTWTVNCVVLSGVLLVLVVANLAVARWRPERLGPCYGLLVASLVANYLFPWQRLPYQASTVGTWLCLAYLIPVFFAGMVFTESFRRSERKSSAFGANIVGAVAGGLAQNVSFVVGMKALLPLAALFYAGAALFGMLEQPGGRSGSVHTPAP